MKKVMFAAAVAASMVAMADITSQNIVGYKNEPVGQFKITSTTFVKVGGSEAWKLGDFKPGGTFIELNDLIQTFTAAGEATTAYMYLTPESAAEYQLTPGWYDTLDLECTTPMNDVDMPYTQGYVVKSRTGATLDFSGQVKDTATEMPVGIFTITANVTPVDLTLGDIVPGGNFIELNDLIQTFTAAGEATTAYMYLTPESAAEYQLTPGWYDTLDLECTTPMNDVPVPAGSGFVVKSRNGATITLPAPIK